MQSVMGIVLPVRSPLSLWNLNLIMSVFQYAPFKLFWDILFFHLHAWLTFWWPLLWVEGSSEQAAGNIFWSFAEIWLCYGFSLLFCLRWCLPSTRTRALPSFCPNTKHIKEKVLHSLDVVSALWIYQNPTALFQESDSLFFFFFLCVFAKNLLLPDVLLVDLPTQYSGLWH